MLTKRRGSTSTPDHEMWRFVLVEFFNGTKLKNWTKMLIKTSVFFDVKICFKLCHKWVVAWDFFLLQVLVNLKWVLVVLVDIQNIFSWYLRIN